MYLTNVRAGQTNLNRIVRLSFAFELCLLFLLITFPKIISFCVGRHRQSYTTKMTFSWGQWIKPFHTFDITLTFLVLPKYKKVITEFRMGEKVKGGKSDCYNEPELVRTVLRWLFSYYHYPPVSEAFVLLPCWG